MGKLTSAMRRPSKTVVTTGEDDDAALVHLAKAADSCVELFLVANLLGLFVSITKSRSIGESGDEPVDAGSYDMFRLLSL